MTANRLVYMFLYAQDLPTSRAFYEDILGFRVMEEDDAAVKYDAGEIILALNRARDHCVDITGEPLRDELIVFHVDDVDAMRAALEARGVAFAGGTERYEIGATATMHDPDGHAITLYQPSSEAMTWPSADKIRRILGGTSIQHTLLSALTQHQRATTSAPADRATSAGRAAAQPPCLGLCKMIYVFRFVSATEPAARFYERHLGLPVIERDAGMGVVKYDGGGVILATHLAGAEPGTPRVATGAARRRGSALVFHVDDIQVEVEKLAARGLDTLPAITRSRIGATVRFIDPDGHCYFLYEPSPAAMSWPSGAKIERLLLA